jgi:hypothetical protein
MPIRRRIHKVSSNHLKLDILLPTLNLAVPNQTILLFCRCRDHPTQLPHEHGHAHQSKESSRSFKNTKRQVCDYSEVKYKCNLEISRSAALHLSVVFHTYKCSKQCYKTDKVPGKNHISLFGCFARDCTPADTGVDHGDSRAETRYDWRGI